MRMRKAPPEWQDTKFIVAMCVVAFVVVSTGGLVAWILIRRFHYDVKQALAAMEVFCAVCFALFGYWSLIRPAMRKIVTESRKQYIYPAQTRALAWSVSLGLILAPLKGSLVGLVATIVLFLILNRFSDQ